MEAQGAYATSIKREINAVGQLIIPLKFWMFLYEKKNKAIASKYADKCRNARRLIPEATCVTNLLIWPQIEK